MSTDHRTTMSFSADFERELMTMRGADLIAKMRNVRALAPAIPETTRLNYARTFDALAAQFTAAAQHLRVYRIDRDDIPDVWREGTETPLDSPATLRKVGGP